MTTSDQAPERRQHKRHFRRIELKFGSKDLSLTGFTVDLSPGGAFIVTDDAPAKDAKLHIKLLYAPGECSYLESEVRWVRPHTLKRDAQRSAFGVRFLYPQTIVQLAVSQTMPVLPFNVKSAAQLIAIFADQIRHGHLTVRSDDTLVANQDVTVELKLHYTKAVLAFGAKVVSVDNSTTPPSVQVVFADSTVLLQALTPYLR